MVSLAAGRRRPGGCGWPARLFRAESRAGSARARLRSECPCCEYFGYLPLAKRGYGKGEGEGEGKANRSGMGKGDAEGEGEGKANGSGMGKGDGEDARAGAGAGVGPL